MPTADEEKAIENLRLKKLSRQNLKKSRPQTEYYPKKASEVSAGEPIPGYEPKKLGFPTGF